MRLNTCFLQFSVLLLTLGIHGQNNDCTVDVVFDRMIICTALLWPDVHHPIYAPIIGGADMDYASDMCKDKNRWEQGMICFSNITKDCNKDPRVSRLLTSFYNTKNLDRGMQYFCNRLNEYGHYAECYFDNRESLMDCAIMMISRLTIYFSTKGHTDTAENWIKNACSGAGNMTSCQVREMSKSCGAPASDHLRDITLRFTPDACGGAFLAPSVLLTALVVAVLRTVV